MCVVYTSALAQRLAKLRGTVGRWFVLGAAMVTRWAREAAALFETCSVTAMTKTIAKRARRLHRLARDAGLESWEECCNSNSARLALIDVVEALVLADGSAWNLVSADPCKLMEVVLNHNDAVFLTFDRAWCCYVPTSARPSGFALGCDEA